MSDQPVLVIQMQRMGDLILSFPLLLDIKRLWPGHPIWVVAEEIFYKPLMNVAPSVTFFSPEHLTNLRFHHFAAVINISFSQKAYDFVGKVRSDIKIGGSFEENGLHIHGFWQLYRHSLTQNNRHNTYHWADLNRLDLRPYHDCVRFERRIRAKEGKRIGLVLGASEEAKHPDLSFWIQLTNALIREGFYPFFFGGKSEEALGEALARKTRLTSANFCGKLSLTQVAAFFETLALCITPDTGPMHLADWLGTPVLNLSMGPVRAHETGPYAPNQWVLLPKMSCAGCWQCGMRGGRCKKKFQAKTVSNVVLALFANKETPPLKHLLFAKTSREDAFFRLYHKEEHAISCQTVLDTFYRRLFAAMASDDDDLWGKKGKEEEEGKGSVAQSFRDLNAYAPKLSSHFKRKCEKLALFAMKGFKRRTKSIESNLLAEPTLIRLLAGFCEMYLQNGNFTPKAWQTLSQWLSHLIDIT